VRGLSRTSVDNLCRRHSTAVAIVNPNDAFVLGGSGEALDTLAVDAMRIGASRVTRIAVNVASHTVRLAAASSAFHAALEQTPTKGKTNSGVRLFSGIDGTAVLDTAAGKNQLAEQISHTVKWADCVESCLEAGASAFLELGPGAALSNMFASAYPNIPSRSLDDFRTIQGVASWVTRFWVWRRVTTLMRQCFLIRIFCLRREIRATRAAAAPRKRLKTLVKCAWVWKPDRWRHIHQRHASSEEHLLSPLDPAAQDSSSDRSGAWSSQENSSLPENSGGEWRWVAALVIPNLQLSRSRRRHRRR